MQSCSVCKLGALFSALATRGLHSLHASANPLTEACMAMQSIVDGDLNVAQAAAFMVLLHAKVCDAYIKRTNTCMSMHAVQGVCSQSI